MRPLVEVKNLTVGYRRIGSASRSIKTDLLRSNKHLARYGGRVKYAVSDVSFELPSDSILGIVGRNGAGKSTLIKTITGVLRPASGYCVTRGRVGALIELGGGFNSDLSAKENIIIHYVLNGFTRKYALDMTDSILEWADLMEEQNEPISTFSSGMMARFAFSTATSIKPEILILDEILGVGDINFQQKSMIRMNELIYSGAAVILISHDLNMIKKNSQQCLWLEDGKMMKHGPTESVIASYEAFMTNRD
jgi:ABC-type polysaccharide/polyol phosphate transport system ATPase subunit